MIARLQKLIVFVALLVAGAWGAYWAGQGRPWVAALGVLAVASVHALVLGLEFLLLRRVHRDDPTPRASAFALAKAWWGEVLTAPVVFCWRQPFRSRVHPDHLPAHAKGRRGLLLVHGFVCNRGIWNPWLARLQARDVPFVAVNLEPMLGSIDAYAAQIEAGVQALTRCTGRPPLVVAHSMGGLAVRAWWRQTQADGRVEHVVTIGSPHHGTWLGRFAQSTNTRQMRLNSRWLQQLADDEPMERYRRFTCFYSHCDNIVFPPSTATLPGADNRHLPGWSHVHLAYHPTVFDEVLRRLQAG